uniref:Uncharacterized protein n=1 Tax=Anguilla anguilla TaxID=7936 RepID=A0A0E9WBT6_ANGAN
MREKKYIRKVCCELTFNKMAIGGGLNRG